MTIFPNYLQRAAAEIAKATPTKRLELALAYTNTIKKLPAYKSSKEATAAVDAGTLTNGSVYYDGSSNTLAIAKGSKKLPVKQL